MMMEMEKVKVKLMVDVGDDNDTGCCNVLGPRKQLNPTSRSAKV